jgi:hypothetical protein
MFSLVMSICCFFEKDSRQFQTLVTTSKGDGKYTYVAVQSACHIVDIQTYLMHNSSHYLQRCAIFLKFEPANKKFK